MDTNTNELALLLDHLSQPAFFEVDGTVVLRNALAGERHIQPGDAVARFLPAELPLPSDPQETVQVTLTLPEERLGATVLRHGEGRVFLLAGSAQAELHPQTLLAVAQSIRTPLSNLFGVASSLFPMLEETEDPMLQRQLASMNRAHYQLLRLACNLTDMRSALLGELKLRREKAELTGFFRELFDRAAPLLHEAGLELQYTCNAKPFCGWIDRQRLERAVWNLLSNTVKFTPRGGTITAELEYTFSAAVLRIHDSGEGVSPAQLTTAFQGYDRICALGDPRWGAGLGLPLAEHIVRLHGGTLMLHTSEGKGTTAVLSLSLSVPGTAELQFHSPTASIDYTGGYAHELVELSDVLPLSEFDSCRIN